MVDIPIMVARLAEMPISIARPSLNNNPQPIVTAHAAGNRFDPGRGIGRAIKNDSVSIKSPIIRKSFSGTAQTIRVENIFSKETNLDLCLQYTPFRKTWSIPFLRIKEGIDKVLWPRIIHRDINIRGGHNSAFGPGTGIIAIRLKTTNNAPGATAAGA